MLLVQLLTRTSLGFMQDFGGGGFWWGDVGRGGMFGVTNFFGSYLWLFYYIFGLSWREGILFHFINFETCLHPYLPMSP